MALCCSVCDHNGLQMQLDPPNATATVNNNTDIDINMNTLSNDHTVVWVTQPERPKGAKDEVKQAQRASS